MVKRNESQYAIEQCTSEYEPKYTLRIFQWYLCRYRGRNAESKKSPPFPSNKFQNDSPDRLVYSRL